LRKADVNSVESMKRTFLYEIRALNFEGKAISGEQLEEVRSDASKNGKLAKKGIDNETVFNFFWRRWGGDVMIVQMPGWVKSNAKDCRQL
jgi:hypothetical protein